MNQYKRFQSPLHNFKPVGERKKRTTGMDMCSCGAFHCDEMMMSNPFYLRKRNDRARNKLCIACGKNPCKCKRKK